jgi:hypothetical protein
METGVDSGPTRGVAQSGSASGWGPEGRWFKSSRPDTDKPLEIQIQPGQAFSRVGLADAADGRQGAQ